MTTCIDHMTLEEDQEAKVKIRKDSCTAKKSKWIYKKIFSTTKGKSKKGKRMKTYYFIPICKDHFK